MSQIDSYLQINLKARHLRLLVALDDFGNLKQVADISHVTVPAVSKALAELERGLGLELFTRSTQGVRPTAYGACLIRHARAMMVNIHNARDDLRALTSGVEGKIQVGISPSWTSVLMPTALAMLRQRSPGTNVLVTEASTTNLLPDLWQGKLDMVIGRLAPRDAIDGLDEIELLDEPVALLTGHQHPLANKKKLKWSDLKPYPWVLPPAGSLLRAPFDRILERHGLALPLTYVETLSSHLATSYILMNHAIGVMPFAAASRDPTQSLHVLPLALPKLLIRPVGVMWNKSRGLTPAAQAMVDSLQKAAGQIQAAA
ncbi:MAG: LysR family transcriptional regulator [Rhodoferax sp.]|nr:LysR family transcriptional regulator [Rhodoferax sp.]